MLEIHTDHKPRDILSWYELTPKEQTEFAWLDTEERQAEAMFVKYKKNIYCIDEFMRVENNAELESWHGYAGDSYFSGTLIRFVEDNERVVMGYYLS